MTTETEALIQKSEKQKQTIIDEISNRPSENLLVIRDWIKKIDLVSPSINIPLITTFIDRIFFYIKNKFNTEKAGFIEKVLFNLIKNWHNLQEQKIFDNLSSLKAYAKNNDANSDTELKKSLDKSCELLSQANSPNQTPVFKDIFPTTRQGENEVRSRGARDRRALTGEAGNASRRKVIVGDANMNPVRDECASHAGRSRPNDSRVMRTNFGDTTAEIFREHSDSLGQKKKLKPRIIEFDEEGKGYEFFYPYRCFLNDINLETELPAKIKKKILQKKLQKELLRGELERLARIEVDQEAYINKIERKIKIKEFDLFASKKEKDERERNLEKKIENDKKQKERQKTSKLLIPKIMRIQDKIELYKQAFDSKSLSLESSLFETSKDDFLVAFLKTIDYEKFKELIIFSEYILNSIDNIRETFKKIDDFSEDLGIASNDIGILDSYYRRIKENFNREGIANFLENALILFEQKILAFDSKYCLLNLLAKKNKEIVFSKLDFLDEYISNYNAQQVFKLLSEDISPFFQVNFDSTLIRNSYLKKNTNMLKKLFNYFSGNYYFFNQSYKDKFVKIFLLNMQEEFTFEFIRNKITKLKWWNFIFSGISPTHVFEKGFKERLSEKLYLKLLEEKFKKIAEKPVPNVENIDKLYAIKNDINSFKNKVQNDAINLNLLRVLDSRQSIVDRLKKDEEIKQLSDNVLILSDQASSCIKEFNELKYVCRTEIEKVSEKNEIFQLNKNDVSKLHFPLKWMR